MKFCDKLPKLRKENNLSQELLADALGVSRQAVSKWESGLSYPDMAKMIEMCNVLNCTLEDLMDDGTIGDIPNNKKEKFNVNNWINDFLKYITKTYNMFFSMKFKDKVKCLLEMAFIGLVLFLLGLVFFFIIDDLVLEIFCNIPKIGYFIYSTLSNIVLILLLIVGIIIFLHLFKIRYLDYFVTIEDKNAKEKVIEEDVNAIKTYDSNGKKQERIIIRDPKHSSFSFFEGLAKIVVFFIKVIVFCIGLGFIFTFILFIISDAFLLGLLQYGVFFFGGFVGFLGISLLNYIVLEFIYNFIFDCNQKFKRMFIMFISGLILTGSGFGISISSVIDFDVVDNQGINYVTDTKYIDFSKYIYFGTNDIVIDNSLDNVKLEISYVDGTNYDLYDYNYVGAHLSYESILPIFRYLLNDIKDGHIRDYDDIFSPKLKVYISSSNYKKLINY